MEELGRRYAAQEGSHRKLPGRFSMIDWHNSNNWEFHFDGSPGRRELLGRQALRRCRFEEQLQSSSR